MKTSESMDRVATSLRFLAGGGEMGALTRAKDWSSTAVGEPETWPQSLRTALSILLNSKFPMFLWWGPELICFYNDAYRPSLGINGKHPAILGMPAVEAWPEIWTIIKPLIDQGKNVLVAAHGNSLRALLIILGENTPENINQTEIPTGSPLVIEFENGARKDKYYLSDKVGAEALLDKALASVSPEVKEKVVEFSHTAEEAAKKALHKADALADQAVGKIKAKLDQTDLDEKLTEEAKKLAAKAGEATRQGIIKGADAVKRAAENPDEAKKAVTEAVSGGWNKLKSVLGSGGSGSKE